MNIDPMNSFVHDEKHGNTEDQINETITADPQSNKLDFT